MQIYNSQSRRKETFVPLHEGKVGIMAGHVYGTEGEGYLRLNLACGREKLYMGLTRLVSVIKNINQGE